MKIVDEIEDVNLLDLKEYKQYFYTLCTLFISLWLYNDIYSSIFCIVCLIPICYYVNQIDTIYWKTLIPIPFMTFLLQMNNLEWLGLTDLIQRIAFVVLWTIGIFIESKVSPEESSTRKSIIRISLIILLLAIIYFTREFSSEVFIKTMCLTVIGYFSSSVILKTFFYTEPVEKTEEISQTQSEI